ncbi:MAG: alpha/beta hydrolase [Myxococcota bacterium]
MRFDSEARFACETNDEHEAAPRFAGPEAGGELLMNATSSSQPPTALSTLAVTGLRVIATALGFARSEAGRATRAARSRWLLLGALPFLAGCAALPETTRQTLIVERDLVFAVRQGGALRADVYRLPGRDRPAVVVVHPGGWVSGDKSNVGRLARRLAEAGYVAVAPRYRLAPTHRFPAQLHDLKEVVRWMRVHAEELGIDERRVAAFGYSSGGHLAALLATSDPEDGLEGPTAFPGVSSEVQALVAGGSPTDLSNLGPNPVVPQLLGGSADELPDLAAAASPVSFVTPDDPPAFLYHGRFDLFIPADQSRRLQQAFAREGVPSQLDLGFFGHFSTWLFGTDQERQAIAFLDRWIGKDAPLLSVRETPAPAL